MSHTHKYSRATLIFGKHKIHFCVQYSLLNARKTHLNLFLAPVPACSRGFITTGFITLLTARVGFYYDFINKRGRYIAPCDGTIKRSQSRYVINQLLPVVSSWSKKPLWHVTAALSMCVASCCGTTWLKFMIVSLSLLVHSWLYVWRHRVSLGLLPERNSG